MLYFITLDVLDVTLSPYLSGLYLYPQLRHGSRPVMLNHCPQMLLCPKKNTICPNFLAVTHLKSAPHLETPPVCGLSSINASATTF